MSLSLPFFSLCFYELPLSKLCKATGSILQKFPGPADKAELTHMGKSGKCLPTQLSLPYMMTYTVWSLNHHFPPQTISSFRLLYFCCPYSRSWCHPTVLSLPSCTARTHSVGFSCPVSLSHALSHHVVVLNTTASFSLGSPHGGSLGGTVTSQLHSLPVLTCWAHHCQNLPHHSSAQNAPGLPHCSQWTCRSHSLSNLFSSLWHSLLSVSKILGHFSPPVPLVWTGFRDIYSSIE